MTSPLDPASDVRRARGFVYRSNGPNGEIVAIFDDRVLGMMVGTDSATCFPMVRTRLVFMTPEERTTLRHKCLRDYLVYETDRNGPKRYSEHDFPLTPEHPIGRLEGEVEPSSETEDRGCPRDPDTSGSGT